MENEKDILKNIKRTENELSNEELSENEILWKISHYKALSLKLCQQIQAMSWKISQADFICRCEDKKQCNYISKIENSNEMVRKFVIPNHPERDLNDRDEFIKNYSTRFELLKRTNIEKKEAISSVEKELGEAQKRKHSLLLKMMNDLEELENEERHLEDVLDQIQCFHEIDNFDTC